MSANRPEVFKRKAFAKWQAQEGLPDASLCRAVQEMEAGLVDAQLGGGLFKKRVPRPGEGKSGGYRTLLSVRLGLRYVFLHGFPKSEKANVTELERKALQQAGALLLDVQGMALQKALQSGAIVEVRCHE